jgi:hypothetical protein
MSANTPRRMNSTRRAERVIRPAASRNNRRAAGRAPDPAPRTPRACRCAERIHACCPSTPLRAIRPSRDDKPVPAGLAGGRAEPRSTGRSTTAARSATMRFPYRTARWAAELVDSRPTRADDLGGPLRRAWYTRDPRAIEVSTSHVTVVRRRASPSASMRSPWAPDQYVPPVLPGNMVTSIISVIAMEPMGARPQQHLHPARSPRVPVAVADGQGHDARRRCDPAAAVEMPATSSSRMGTRVDGHRGSQRGCRGALGARAGRQG